MAGWLTNDITRLTGLMESACAEIECTECPFHKYTECPGELIFTITISLETLRRAVERCGNMFKEQL